ncbi:MAG TPA: hypothetical protein VFH06_01910 [Candidatus Saccharimonadales bacterium]|nr:hypothetical protein [Candidatus Saccharimonadales bacterium]
MQHSTYQNNQFLLMGITIFASITAAVIVSTLVIMSLMKGEVASALSSHVENNTPTSQTTGTCAAPVEATAPAPQQNAAADSAPVATGAHYFHYVPSAKVTNSFNNTSSTTTTNNITNTEVKTTVTNVKIKDSFNKDSYNDNSKNPIIIKDNTVNVNSNNNTAVNSGNTTNTTNVTANTTNVNSNNTTVASNNTAINSGNTVENHVLSDNTIVAVLPTI